MKSVISNPLSSFSKIQKLVLLSNPSTWQTAMEILNATILRAVSSWPYLQVWGPQVHRVSMSLWVLPHFKRWKKSWKTWTGIWRCGSSTVLPKIVILVNVFEDSITYLQFVVQIMYIAPTTVHQCSASWKASHYTIPQIHKMRKEKLPEPVVIVNRAITWKNGHNFK